MEDKTKRFADEMLRRRKELRMSQTDVAKLVGTTKQMISKYERCERSPKIEMANTIANALQTTLDEIMGETQQTLDTDRLEALHQNPKLGLLFDRQRKMSEADIDFMLQMADRIAKENYGE